MPDDIDNTGHAEGYHELNDNLFPISPKNITRSDWGSF